MAQNFRNNHKDRMTDSSKVRGAHIAPKKKPKHRPTHEDSARKKKSWGSYTMPSCDCFDNVPQWVYGKLNLYGPLDLDYMFEQDYKDAVRLNKPPFVGNVLNDFWYDDKMSISDIKESLRLRWLAENSKPYGRLWNIVYDEMSRRYDADVATRIGIPNGKKFREDYEAAPHEDDELFLHSDKFKEAFENAVKIPLSGWRVLHHGGKKIERMEFMCQILIGGQLQTMLGCFERRFKKSQFIQHGGSSIMMCGYFRGDSKKRFTVRRQDYKPPYSHKNKLQDGKLNYRINGKGKQNFALNVVDVKDTNHSHEHNYTLSQRLFTNVRFSVDCEPTDKSRKLGREYVYNSFDEMSAEFMKNKNLLMCQVPLYEIQKDSVVRLAEKYCPVYDAEFGSNFDIPKTLKKQISLVQEALLRANKSPYETTGHLEEVFGLNSDQKNKKHKKDAKKENQNFTEKLAQADCDEAVAISNGEEFLEEEENKYGEQKFVSTSTVVQNLKRNTERRHKKQKPMQKNGSHEFDYSPKAKEMAEGMKNFKRKKKKNKSNGKSNIDAEYYEELKKELGFDMRDYDDIEENSNENFDMEEYHKKLEESLGFSVKDFVKKRDDEVYDDDSLGDEVENEEDNYER